MNKPQIILIIFGVLLIVGLYSLPRVVVENETESEIEAHNFTVTPADAAAIASLNQLLNTENSEKNTIFADSLARYYLKYGFTDSAYVVVQDFMLGDSSLNALKLSGNLLYTLYERSSSPEEMAQLGKRAGEVLSEVLENEPENLAIKTRLAMTMVTSTSPMAGIQMLREVLDADPDNREAILNLGLLSIRSSQYDRGIERFQTLVEMNEEDYEAMLFLGVCYMETQKMDSASIWFEKIVAAENADPALQSAAAEYLQN